MNMTSLIFTLTIVLIVHQVASSKSFSTNHHRQINGQNHRNDAKKGSDYRLEEDMRHPLGHEDFERAKKLNQKDFAIKDDVLYQGKFFEGDIANDVLINTSDEKNAIRNSGAHWPHGEIPYVISQQFSPEERAIIARAIDEYHGRTCIKFKPYQGQEPNYIHFVKSAGCSSRVGMAGGQQEVSLGNGCATVGIVEHELMHALGFVHEQSRTDRDQYVRINYNNIKRGLEQNFRKYSFEEIDSLREPYDYNSVLHYGVTAFSNGDGPTIEPLKRSAEIGQRVGFSKIDLNKINKLYRCGNRKDEENTSSSSRPNKGEHDKFEKPQQPNRRTINMGFLPNSLRPNLGSLFPPILTSPKPTSERPWTHYSSTLGPNYEPSSFRPDEEYRRPNQKPRPGYGGSEHNRYSTTRFGIRPNERPYEGNRPSHEIGRPAFGNGNYDRYSTTSRNGNFGGSNGRYDFYSTTPVYSSAHGSNRFRPPNRFTNNRPYTYRPEAISPTFEENRHRNNRRPGGVSSFFRPNRFSSVISSLFGDEKQNKTMLA